MKIKNFWSVALAALVALTGCDIEQRGTDDSNDMNYLAVSIIANATDTKAPGDQTSGDPNGGATYEEGLENENAVNKVRFYFFNSEDEAMACVNGGASYYDWTPSSDGSSMPNVEKSLVATIVLKKVGDTGDNISETSYPTQVVAVLNPDYANLPVGNPSLADLRSTMSNYAATTGNANGFVMCNSGYIDETADPKVRIATASIAAENVCIDPSTALAHPISIHVERCVAKVRVGYGEGMGIGKIVAAKDKDGHNVEVTEYNADGTPKADKKQVYVKLTGWNLTATTNQVWLSKHIYPSWTDAQFGGLKWNYAPYFRSFWAENPTNAGQDYFDFNEIGEGETHLYTNENAATKASADDQLPYEREFPTQVIVAAQLVDSEGNALEVCEYAGQKFVGESNLVTQMTNFASVYKRTGTGTVADPYVYTKIAPSDVKLVTALANGSAQSGQKNHGRYYVELKLSGANMADDDATVWTSSNIEGATVITKTQVNAALKAVGHAKCWNEGMAYYYFPIRHLAEVITDEEKLANPNIKRAGVYGVVRNHIYNCTLKSIVGLGTPVYDPEETIWPEKPQPEQDTYIAAKINILSWRVVNQNVDLTSY